MAFLADMDCDVLRAWVKHSPSKKIISTDKGQILWASEEFVVWSKYTWLELSRMTWMELSVSGDDSESSESEMEVAKRALDDYNHRFTVEKRYTPKHEQPQWGRLTVMRFPPIGDMQYYGCTWEPRSVSTSAAFDQAMEQAALTAKTLRELTVEIRLSNARTDEETFLLSGVRMAQRHRRATLVLIIILLSIFGLNNVVELLQRLSIFRLPIDTRQGNDGHAALQIADVVAAVRVTATTPKGRQIEWWSVGDSGRAGPVSITAGRTGPGTDRPGCSHRPGDREATGPNALPNGKHVSGERY